jgi:ATPase subunit of ABC transporter with duplicated ATPase domains
MGSDFLFLDEPTNNLDRAAIDGLVSFLKLSQATCLIISHDKKFLNKIVSSVFEIADEKITEYAGNYKSYTQAKKKEYLDQQDQYIKQQEEYDRMGLSKKNLLTKATRLANKGNTKDGDKGDGSNKVAKRLARQAKAIQSRVGQIEEVEKPKEEGSITLAIVPENVSTGSIQIDNLHFAYPESDFSLTIKELTIASTDKLLIQGANGEGKSTFLKLLLGDLSPQHGTITIAADLSRLLRTA